MYRHALEVTGTFSPVLENINDTDYSSAAVVLLII